MSTRLAHSARLVSLLRLLLLALALGVLVFAVEGVDQPTGILVVVRWILVAVAGMATVLIFTVHWTRWTWQIVLHLVFDLLWLGVLLYGTGGVASPAVPLLFAVVLIANLVIPGAAPFVISALAALVLAVVAALYLGGNAPLPAAWLQARPALLDTHRILGQLAVQVGGLFLVDLLAQLLTRRLREQRLYTSELLGHLGEGVVAIDSLGQVAYANEESIRLLDLPDTEIVGRPILELIGAPSLAPVRDLIGNNGRSQVRRMEGSEGRHLVLRLSAMTDDHGNSLGQILLVSDETRVLLLEESARRAEHLAGLGEMAAGIAHEIRNPLASLRGCAQELADVVQKGDPADARTLSTILVTEADRLGRIVEDFLQLSKMRSPYCSRLDPGEVFHELERLFKSRRDLPPGLELTWEIDESCPDLHADADQIRQVLTNLVTNALDAVRLVAHPVVHCRARSTSPEENPLDGPTVVLSVQDNGHGIPLDQQQRIFTPFFSTKAQGTGLGLSLVDRIIREHEGVVRLQSTPGRGTILTIYLPSYSNTREYRRPGTTISSAINPIHRERDA